MSRLYTRRAFLALTAITATALGLAKFGHLPGAERVAMEGRCPKCKAFYTQAHKHKDKHTSGVYCPNCGIELTKQAYDLAPNNRFHLIFKSKRRNKRAMVWDWAQVPFPNAGLIRQTDKPTVVFSEMQI